MKWMPQVQLLTPYIFRIETQQGSGTGTLYFRNEDRTLCAIATAAHVIAQAYKWRQPIQLIHEFTDTTIFLEHHQRSMFVDTTSDSAIILLPDQLQFPQNLIPLIPVATYLAIGEEIGWAGYPAPTNGTLCFFSGGISGYHANLRAYYVDGIGIHGVSGGPVVYIQPDNSLSIIGIVSQYVANRSTGEALPGVVIAQDVSHFHSTTSRVKSLEEAQAKSQEYQVQDYDFNSSSSSSSASSSSHR